MPMNNPAYSLKTLELLAWRAQLAAAAAVSVQPVNLDGCQSWSIKDGALVHDTGRFFQVVGLEWIDEAGICAAPFLRQREIGLLATILREPGKNAALMVQVKSEPGNFGGAQFAPTCQATSSNIDAIHGGTLPPYSAYFESVEPEILTDSLQSEQGGKFLEKRNRNLLVCDDDAHIEGDAHDWVLFREFQPLLGIDFAVNTDLRSVLVCCNWQDLVGEDVFAGNEALKTLLRRSYNAPFDDASVADVQERLSKIGDAAPGIALRPLDALAGWQFSPASHQLLSDGTASITLLAVDMVGREVAAWHQPFYSSGRELIYDIDVAIVRGILCFAFRPCWEPGLPKGPELGPAHCRAANAADLATQVYLQVRQSDEGGRFFCDIATYRITAGAHRHNDGLVWLTLSQVQYLLGLGFLNNEARSGLSLLLVHL